MIASGDLYRFAGPSVPRPGVPHLQLLAKAEIPVFPRRRYHSYLKVIRVEMNLPLTTEPCQLTILMQEYAYRQPMPGLFDGSFPETPTRTVRAILSPQMAPVGFSGNAIANSAPIESSYGQE
jgi:hypothetical protein